MIDDIKQDRTKKVNQYAILQKLGQGANCKVFLVQDTNTSKYYACKIFNIDHKARSPSRHNNLEREIRMMKLMSSEYVVSLHDVLYASKKKRAYVIMEWADCGTLQDIIDKKTPLDEYTLKKIFLQVLNALEFVHSNGIVHQDIKPSNIMMFSSGKIKLGDFGIGHSFQSADTVIGSPAYQAPEVFVDLLDESEYLPEFDPAKEDIWSLGVSLFEAKFHYLPFKGDNAYEIPRYIKEVGLVIPPGSSPEYEDLLKKMLDTNPATRITLAEIKEHPFFAGVEDTEVHLCQPDEPDKIDPKLMIHQICAVVCDDNFCFASPMLMPMGEYDLPKGGSQPNIAGK